jgi:5-methylcytosine-specific restriction endonuclease McrA
MKAKTVYKIFKEAVKSYPGDKTEVLKFIDWIEHSGTKKLRVGRTKTKYTKTVKTVTTRTITIDEILSDKSKYRTHYLKHPIWKAQKKNIIEANRISNGGVARCEACGFTEATTTLDPHHRVYRKRNMMNPFCINDVLLMCRSCHDLIHNYRDGGMTLRKATDVVVELKRGSFIKE